MFFVDLTTKAPLTCVLQAGWGVGRWREAVGSGLEGGRRLVADALGPLPALDSQAASAGLVAVHPAGCRRMVHVEGEGRREGEVTGEEERTGGSEEREGESPREEARGEEGRGEPGARGRYGVGWRERVRQRDGRKRKHRGEWKS